MTLEKWATLLGYHFNDDGSPDTAVPPSDDDITFREHQYSA